MKTHKLSDQGAICGINISVLRSVVAVMAVASLAACGGGSTEDSQSARALRVDSSKADVDSFYLASKNAPELLDPSGPNARAMAAGDPPPPPSCATMYLGTLGIRCLSESENLVTAASVQGTSAANISTANQFCTEIPVGELQYGVTPSPGTYACYQFVANASATYNYEVALPAGLIGKVEYYGMKPSGAGFALARSATTSSPQSGGITIQYSRMVLVIRAANGVGGQVFPFAINASIPQPASVNNSVASAYSISLNEEVNGSLSGPLASAYYFFPLGPNQTTAILTSTFNFANIQVAYASAQRTAPGTYSVGPEIVLSGTQANQQQVSLTSSYPANTAGTTTPAGIMVRVTGINAAAQTGQPFTLRVGARAVSIVGMETTNDEAISRWYPTPTAMLQAANFIITKAGVKDQNGSWVKNHPVDLKVQANTSDSSTLQIFNYKSNLEGKMAPDRVLLTSGSGYPVKTSFGACTGTVQTKLNYGPPGTPTDHWNGTAQSGAVTVSLPGASPSAQLSFPFTRICTETYLGRS